MSSVSESIRRILTEYSFEVENPELTCILCKKIMIDAYQSFCGCNYCQGCVTNFLTGERKHCVGNKEECKEEYLVLDKNVTLNPRINNRILKLKIRCPYDFCTFETELSQLEDHLQECTERPIPCPFLNMGCSNERGSKNDLITHLHKEEWTHANMLSEFVENTKNEIQSLKEESIKKEIQMKDIIEEISILRESSRNKEVAIVEMKRQIEDQRIEIDGLKDDAGRREREMEVMRKELERMRESQKKTMMEEVENVKREMKKMDVRGESMDHLRENQENIRREIRSVSERVRDSGIYDESREFMWRIDNLSKMKEGRWRGVILWRYSRKLHIEVKFDGYNVGFLCRIMKGEFDDILKWPMKHKIRLSLMNQDTMEVYKCNEYGYDTCRVQYTFDKPTAGWNDYCIHDLCFTTVNDIKNVPGVLSQDSLIVSFSIDNP